MSKVERALLADVPAIAALQMDAFSDDYFTVTKFPIEGGVGERYYAGGWEGFVRREEEKRTGLRSRAVVIRGENGEFSLPSSCFSIFYFYCFLCIRYSFGGAAMYKRTAGVAWGCRCAQGMKAMC